MFHFILPKFIFNIERWKWNSEYRVYVSNMGHFKDEHKKLLPFLINDGGYILIKTSYGLKKAHRLVMLTWVPIPNAESLIIDHIDHNKRNNALSNLEWVTERENQRRADRDFVKDTFNMDNKKIICIEENRVFKNKREAAEWLMNSKICHPDMNENSKQRIFNRIGLAIKRNTPYNGYHWAVKE